MRILILGTLVLALAHCGPKSNPPGDRTRKPQPDCAVKVDKRSAVTAARSGFELRETCGLSEEQVVQAFGGESSQF